MPKMLHLSQRDPRWSNTKIGKTNLTIGNWGCALTSVSMLGTFYGVWISPDKLAKYPGLFTSDGRIIWSKIAEAYKDRLKFDWRQYGRDDKRIVASINGSPKTCVILEVNNGRHWVVGISVLGKDYWIADPIDGRKKLFSKTYPNITGSTHLIGSM